MQFWKTYIVLSALAAGCTTFAAAEPSQPVSGEYLLTDFGDVSTPKAILATVDKAIQAIEAKGGGTLVIPPSVDQSVNIQNTAETQRLHGWVVKPTVTILDRRAGYEKTLVPSIGKWSPSGWFGLGVRRELNFDGPGLSSWGNSQAVSIENRVIQGASSYLHPVQGAVSAGKDARMYLYTERGLFVGQYLNY